MTPQHPSSRRPSRLRPLFAAAVFVAALTGFLWPARAAQAVIQPGESAPPFALQDLEGRTRALDAATTGSVLLVFVKPDEKFTSQTLLALDHMILGVPEFRRDLKRWIVVSRFDSERQVRQMAVAAGPGWPVIADENDKLYRAYRIIATPTLVVVAGGKVKAVHPGYDPGMEDVFRRALADAMGINLPADMTQAPEKPNMPLQMGRRMAARGLWDRALELYQQAQAAAPLAAPAQVEMARILIELARYDEAIAMLEKIPAASPGAEGAAAALARARALKAGLPVPTPPKVTR